MTANICTKELSFLILRACLHGGRGPEVGEVTRGGSPHLTGVPHLHVNRPKDVCCRLSTVAGCWG